MASLDRSERMIMQMLAAATVVAMAGIGGGWVKVAEGATWCIARSGASATALQAALDYACGSVAADCVPVQMNGLCYLPNTLPNHASYAFNSFYQRSNSAPGSCDFGGTATVTITDPSYGSCTYPSSASTAGGTASPTAPTNNSGSNMPLTTHSPPPFGGITGGGSGLGGLSPPGFGTSGPSVDTSGASGVSPFSYVLCYFLIFLAWNDHQS